MVRIAHFSDLHVLGAHGAPLRKLVGKRITGYLNFRLRRAKHHVLEHARAVAADLSRQKVDHVVFTGDMSNLALDGEFEAARDLLERELDLGPTSITVVPGNHDRYTAGSYRSKRFESWFEPYLRSDLPNKDKSVFPFVRFVGPLAIVGLNTGVPRFPFVAAGEIGASQLLALQGLMARDELEGRPLVLLAHHPLLNPSSALKTYLEGLRDADQLRRVLGERSGMALHGHLHRRMARRSGNWLCVGATSASLRHGDATRMAGYNVYAFGNDGELHSMRGRVLDASTDTFHEVEIPLVADAADPRNIGTWQVAGEHGQL